MSVSHDIQYSQEEFTWGFPPSKTAVYAKGLFSRYQVKKILVPACNDCRNSEYFANCGFDVTGIDESDVAIAVAMDMPNHMANYYDGDGPDLQDKSKYDAVFCFKGLHLYSEVVRHNLIERYTNNLKDGGYVFFAEVCEKEPACGRGIQLEDNTFRRKDGRAVHFFTEDDIRYHFNKYSFLGTGIIEDPDNHEPKGLHSHFLRYIFAQKVKVYDSSQSEIVFNFQRRPVRAYSMINELHLQGDETILDLSCGEGDLSSMIAGLVPRGRVVGIDSSDEMLKNIRNNYKVNLKFSAMDLNGLNFREEFDLVLSYGSLHLVKDHKKLLSNCFMALKGNGTLRLNFEAHGSRNAFIAVVTNVMHQQRFQNDFADFQWPWFMPTIKEYESLIYSFSFADTRIWGEDEEWFFNENELVDWVDGFCLAPFLSHINKMRRGIFRQQVIDEMLNKVRMPGGRFCEMLKRLNVHAIKGDF